MTKLYDLPATAELLSLHVQQVRELIWANELTWVNVAKPGSRPRIRVEHAEIERFIKARRSKSARVAA